METKEVTAMVANFLDCQDIVEPVEGELMAVMLAKNELVLVVITSPNRLERFTIKIERFTQ